MLTAVPSVVFRVPSQREPTPTYCVKGSVSDHVASQEIDMTEIYVIQVWRTVGISLSPFTHDCRPEATKVHNLLV